MLIFCHSEERNDEESAVGKADSSHFSALRASEKLGMTTWLGSGALRSPETPGITLCHSEQRSDEESAWGSEKQIPPISRRCAPAKSSE